jgi:uncharacterized protein YbaR (Trm112 family)
MTEAEIYRDLVCPVGKYPLEFRDGHLICTNCGAKFPVNNGIPDLIIDDAILPEGVSSYNDLKCFQEKSVTK